jgi:hypothetical protein
MMSSGIQDSSGGSALHDNETAFSVGPSESGGSVVGIPNQRRNRATRYFLSQLPSASAFFELSPSMRHEDFRAA